MHNSLRNKRRRCPDPASGHASGSTRRSLASAHGQGLPCVSLIGIARIILLRVPRPFRSTQSTHAGSTRLDATTLNGDSRSSLCSVRVACRYVGE